jgi:hypothetical protein
MLAALCFLLGLGLMAASRPAASWFFLLAGLFICGGVAAAYIRAAIAKAQAIRLGKREVDLFFGLIKLVLWEQNEGLLFLKNKRVTGIVFGPDDGGGTKLIFPFLGDELKLHLPLTLQMCWFEDRDVVTRESIRLFMKLAIWWKVKDKRGIDDFYRLINKEIHVGSSGSVSEAVYTASDLGRGSKGSRRAELIVAEKWIQTLAESCLRKIVSHTSTAFIVSRQAVGYLHVEPTPQNSASDHEATTPGVLAKNIGEMLNEQIEEYGLHAERVEIQEVQLSKDIQESIDRVWKATLLPAQSKQEAEARYIQVSRELEAVKSVIGEDATRLNELLKNFRGSTFFGGMPKPLVALLSPLVSKSAKTALAGTDAVPTAIPAVGAVAAPPQSDENPAAAATEITCECPICKSTVHISLSEGKPLVGTKHVCPHCRAQFSLGAGA